ncbi:hypothetical protein BCR35DRAFT_306941 [Leucosporidium creatinivorum]|uniref:Uncharacterized protein n=1 Tax=Leucosporidium creatinivorum TaxID=106004 RepID=A0A1Y2EQM2_9BASI|nr:hypothetical protein BCR35DRAFT_306941 [Leucosporidium creatinivorum]
MGRAGGERGSARRRRIRFEGVGRRGARLRLFGCGGVKSLVVQIVEELALHELFLFLPPTPIKRRRLRLILLHLDTLHRQVNRRHPIIHQYLLRQHMILLPNEERIIPHQRLHQPSHRGRNPLQPTLSFLLSNAIPDGASRGIKVEPRDGCLLAELEQPPIALLLLRRRRPQPTPQEYPEKVHHRLEIVP